MHLYENGKPVRLVSWWPDSGTAKDEELKNYFRRQFPIMQKWLGGLGKLDPGSKNSDLDSDALSELGPSAQQKLSSGTYTAREGQYRLQSSGNWVQLPKVWEIPGMGAKGVRWGLHLPSIRDWWDNHPPEKYVMVSTTHNCAGAVACALQRGGADSFVKAPVSGIYLGPNYIANWSQMLQDRLWELEINTSRLHRKVREANLGESHGLPRPVPSKEQWMKATYLAYKPRSYQLRAIDTALGNYYAKLAEGEGPLSFGVKKHEMLVKLVDAIYNHVSTRPSSERRKWVLSLADCVLCVVNAMNMAVPAVVPVRPPRPLHFN